MNTRPWVLALTLCGAAVVSTNTAVALHWKRALERVSVAPGALAPELASECAARSSGRRDDDLDAERLARRVEEWRRGMSVERLEAAWSELDPDRSSTVRASVLATLDHDGLVRLIASDPNFAQRIVAGSMEDDEFVPCGKTAVSARCESGVKCNRLKCSNEDGSEELCNTYSSTVSTFLCPNYTMTVWHCKDPCPTPPWIPFAGALAASVWSALQARKRFPL